MNDKEKMIQGKLYNSSNGTLVKERMQTRELVYKYNKTRPHQIKKRKRLLSKIFTNCNTDTTFLEPNIRVEYGYNVIFGQNFYMNFDCSLLDVAPIKIGDNCMFGPQVMLATPMHPIYYKDRIVNDFVDGTYNIEYSKPITIGNNVWLAANVTICGGVTIGDNVVIGAGSVVTKNIPSNVLAFGTPCRAVKNITTGDCIDVYKQYLNNN